MNDKDKIIINDEMVNGELSMVNKKENSQFTTHNSPLKKGYKQTEVGVIPEDWEIVSITSIIENGNGIKIGPFGSQLKKELLTNSGYKVYGQENVYNKNMEIGKRYISKEHYRKLINCEIKKGDFLISMMGTIGKCMIVPENFEPGIMDSHLIRLRLNYNKINPEFLLQFFSSNHLLLQVKKLSVGGIMDGLSSKIVKQLQIPLPPTKAEQAAIATALSDMDVLIEKLEQLIQKKKNIKQGAMQELLKPKEGWVEKRLGEIAEIKKGQLITSSTKIEGNIPVIAGGKTPAYYHKYANRKGKTITISASGANAGYISFHNYPIFASDCSTISENASYSIEYIYYVLLKKQDVIYGLQTGGAQPHIHPSDISPIEIPLPPTKKEQTRIAKILSDMDEEIEKLETQLSKYKMIKTGMMQELLTGKKRLV